MAAGTTSPETPPDAEASPAKDPPPFASLLDRIGRAEVTIVDRNAKDGKRTVTLRPLSAAMQAVASAAFAPPPAPDEDSPDAALAFDDALVAVQLNVSLGLACALVGLPVRTPDGRDAVFGDTIDGRDLHGSMIRYMRLAAEQHREAFGPDELNRITDAAYDASDPDAMRQQAGNSSAPRSKQSSGLGDQTGSSVGSGPSPDGSGPTKPSSSSGPSR
ncbi:MAG: hypothetical protein AAGF47_03780 [Planctomycetota bacterium]